MCSVLCGPNQNASSNKPSVLAVLCSCSRKTPSAWVLQGLGKDKLSFSWHILLANVIFPLRSSLKLLFLGLALVRFSPAPQVSLGNFLLFFLLWVASEAVLSNTRPAHCAVTPSLLLLTFKPRRKIWSKPMQMGEEASPASVCILPFAKPQETL